MRGAGDNFWKMKNESMENKGKRKAQGKICLPPPFFGYPPPLLRELFTTPFLEFEKNGLSPPL